MFPRAAAIAEVGWSPAGRIDWQSFSARLPDQLARYRALGVGFAQAPEAVAAQPGRRTSHELASCSEKILLSLEDDAPLQGERAVFLVDIMNPCWIYRDADLSEVSAHRGVGRAGAVQFPDRRRREEDSVAQAAERGGRAGGAHRRLRRREDRHAAARAGGQELRRDGARRRWPSRSAPGQHDLCFTFTQAAVDPLWVLDAVQLVGLADAEGGAHPATAAVNR